MQEKFLQDLEKVYNLITKKHNETSKYYDILDKDSDPKKVAFINNFLKKVRLDITKENQMSAITRLVSLRDDSLTQAFKKAEFSEDEIIDKKEEAYIWVSTFHINMHQELIDQIEKQKLLTPFYRAVFKGVHDVGLAFSDWQSSWTKKIINGVNKDLYNQYNGNDAKIFQMLNEKNLIDQGHHESKGDRSYSMLVKENGEYKSLAYAEAFNIEVKKLLFVLSDFKDDLYGLEDEVYGQEDHFDRYLQSLILALVETNTDNLIKMWADVDRKWMKITAPLQIGHPLEYYEDHYRKAVALEWDLRITNPTSKAGDVKQSIKSMYEQLIQEIKTQDKDQEIYERSLSNTERVQLYIGRPALYYGAEFCGLFSAQVVPNDEVVTKEEGKKIFAFADNVLDSTKAKPFMKIQKEIFDKEFLDRSREVIFKKPKIWHDVYNITTIGHEYGHILWLDNDTETIMNEAGNFKNIEEFKATTGGLVAFFLNEKEDLKYHILSDVVKRAIGLIAWKETGEVEPYYCEGLMHLSGLFETGVLKFNNKLEIDMSNDAYEKIKTWYIKTYKELASHYLKKQPATEFLYKYAKKDGKYFMPTDNGVRYFVNYYWNLHQDMGQIIDDSGDKENWIQ
jgi:hypothetical protein